MTFVAISLFHIDKNLSFRTRAWQRKHVFFTNEFKYILHHLSTALTNDISVNFDDKFLIFSVFCFFCLNCVLVRFFIGGHGVGILGYVGLMRLDLGGFIFSDIGLKKRFVTTTQYSFRYEWWTEGYGLIIE